MRDWIGNNIRWAGPAAVVGAAVLAFLAFGVFGIHTLFIDDEVNEDVPVFTSGAGASGLPSDVITEAEAAEMNEVMENEGTPIRDEVTEDMPMEDVPEIVTVVEGTFIGREHPSSGVAKVITDGSEQRFLRFEDFETDNGPDLSVYLATSPADGDAGLFDDDFVDLGKLKGNIGPQNYEIDPAVDLSRYNTVVIWCVRFGVAFGAADLVAS